MYIYIAESFIVPVEKMYIYIYHMMYVWTVVCICVCIRIAKVQKGGPASPKALPPDLANITSRCV